MEKNGKKKYFTNWIWQIKIQNYKPNCISVAGFGDLIDEVVGIGVDKRFGDPFGDGGTLLHEWSKSSK